MARVTVEDCLEKVPGRFTLVHLAVRRVLQLRRGAPLTLDAAPKNREVVLALREIAAGAITSENIRESDERDAPFVEALLPGEEANLQEVMEILEEDTRKSLDPASELEGETEVKEEGFEEAEEDS